MTKIINFIGGPCIGKSTLATKLFFHMKTLGLNVEYLPEYIKFETYSRDSVHDWYQFKVFAIQNDLLSDMRLSGIDYVITDSPLILPPIYYNGHISSFLKFALDVFNDYDNVNFLLYRTEDIEFSGIGRFQKTIDSARKIDENIRTLLNSFNIKYFEVTINSSSESLMEYVNG